MRRKWKETREHRFEVLILSSLLEHFVTHIQYSENLQFPQNKTSFLIRFGYKIKKRATSKQSSLSREFLRTN